MALHAIVTAGGKLPRAFSKLAASPVKALLPVGGRTLLDTAVWAARGCPEVSRIAVVGGREVKLAIPSGADYVAEGSNVVDNIFNCFRHLGEDAHDYLVISPDLPFLSAAALTEFIAAARPLCELGAPLVTREDFLARFPGAPNWFERIDGQKVTMGSCLYLNGAKLKVNFPLFRDLYNMRKYPWRLATMLGFPILLGYLTRSMKLAPIERRFSRLMDATVRAVPVRDAGIACDVDTLRDYRFAERLLARPGSTG